MLTYIVLVELSILGFMLAFKQRKLRKKVSTTSSPWMFASVLTMAIAVMQGFDTMLQPAFQALSLVFTEMGVNQSLTEISLLLIFAVFSWAFCYRLPVFIANRGQSKTSDLGACAIGRA
jgi:hypothetical protein